jgi:hypothetical protein
MRKLKNMPVQYQDPNRILPNGYYLQNENNPYLVTLNMGPFKGLKIQIVENIKIRTDYLTSTPQMLYNYKVLHYAGYDPHQIETSKDLSRIIAAIAVELAYFEATDKIDPTERQNV